MYHQSRLLRSFLSFALCYAMASICLHWYLGALQSPGVGTSSDKDEATGDFMSVRKESTENNHAVASNHPAANRPFMTSAAESKPGAETDSKDAEDELWVAGTNINDVKITQEICEPTPSARMANTLLQGDGIILRTKDGEIFERDLKAGRDFLPASFVHYSMRAPNVMYREDKESLYHRANVGFLIGSKFKRHSQMTDLIGAVDCRAYYPTDSWSVLRHHSLFHNELGTSCTRFQKAGSMCVRNGTACLYNVTNNCSCNYDDIPGRDYGKLMEEKKPYSMLRL